MSWKSHPTLLSSLLYLRHRDASMQLGSAWAAIYNGSEIRCKGRNNLSIRRYYIIEIFVKS